MNINLTERGSMNRLLNKAKRFCVRLWYLNRNQMLAKSSKILIHALRARRSIIMGVPENRREELFNADFVLSSAVSLQTEIGEYLKEVGYEK